MLTSSSLQKSSGRFENTLLDLQVKMDDPPASGANAVPDVTWLKEVGGVPDLHFFSVWDLEQSFSSVQAFLRMAMLQEVIGWTFPVLSWKVGMFGIF